MILSQLRMGARQRKNAPLHSKMQNKKQDNTHTQTKYKSVFKQMQSPNTKWSKFWAGCVLPSYAERWAAGSSPQIRYLLASLHIMPSIIYAYII